MGIMIGYPVKMYGTSTGLVNSKKGNACIKKYVYLKFNLFGQLLFLVAKSGNLGS